MSVRRKLLWIDGSAALAAGMITLLIGKWLAEWYNLPRQLITVVGAVNILYSFYSLPLAARSVRPMKRIMLLVAGNAVWAAICLVLALAFREPATIFGLAHLVVEGLFVGGLAYMEWRWRECLRTA